MEIKQANDGLLTNVEVIEILKDNQALAHLSSTGNETKKNADFVEMKTLNYLLAYKHGRIPIDRIASCIARIKHLNLPIREQELIQIANLLPQTDVEYYSIIEDCSGRIGDENVEKIKEVVNELLNQPIENEENKAK